MKLALAALGAALCSTLAAPAPLAAQAPRSQPRGAAAPMQAELEMKEREAAFRPAVDAFLAAAAAGDTARTEAMISPNLRAQAGEATVARVIRTQVLPFFADHPERGGATTITETTDQFRSRGFAYYLYAAPRGGGEARPFVLYVVLEDGRPVIANVLVNHFVEGRHQ
jgi:hypothetical protein